MKYSAIILLLGVCISSLTGCANRGILFQEKIHKAASIFTPTPLFIRNLPKGDDSYSQGFRDGCTIFMGLIGTGALRLLSTEVDGFRLTKDRLYARGWSDGSSNCTFYLDYETH